MSEVTVRKDRVFIGERFSVSFQRTLRIPEDARTYTLPPGLGAFPVHSIEDYRDRVPADWQNHSGVFIPMYQREALWLGFDAASWKPNAVKVAVGKINAVSGEPWDERLHEEPQDYLVCPDQPWLDGINAGEGVVRQFVAMPLGLKLSVEYQLSRTETFGGIQITVFEPKPGRFPDEPPPQPKSPPGVMRAARKASAATAMGIAAGGNVKQKVYPDKHGIDAWDQDDPTSVFVHIVNSEQYSELTGLAPPATPITAKTYVKHGLPWFDLYDESYADVAAPEKLKGVKTIGEIDTQQRSEDESVDVPGSRIKKLHI